MEKADKWDRRFMELTETVAGWSSCFQENRHVGAIIVKDKRVMTTGYNGAPAGVKSCEEKGECLRRKLNIPSGNKTGNLFCRSCGAERYYSSRKIRNQRQRSDVVLYASALCDLRENDYQRGNFASGI